MGWGGGTAIKAQQKPQYFDGKHELLYLPCENSEQITWYQYVATTIMDLFYFFIFLPYHFST